VRDNVSLRRLTLDNNCIMQISNLGNLPLRHLSLANNRLSAVNGYLELDPDVLEIFLAFEETYEEMETAFEAFDANADGTLNAHEFRAGLEMVGVKAPKDLINRLISFLDKSGDGVLQASEFLALLRRARPEDNADPGIRPLTQLESINLSGNPISSLLGLEGHPCLRQVNMAGTGIKELQDVVHVQSLPVLQHLNLSETPLFKSSQTLASSSCMRLKVLHILARPQGKCKLDTLNGLLVSAEELVSAANFHDPNHRQHQDCKRDDSQDLPPGLFV